MNAFQDFFHEEVDSSLREDLEYSFLKELKNGGVTQKTKYRYAWCLLRSTIKSDWSSSLRLFKEILAEERDNVDCLYHLIYANVKLRNYSEAFECCDNLLKNKPDHRDAKYIRQYVEEQKNDNSSNVFLILALASAVTVFYSFVYFKSK